MAKISLNSKVSVFDMVLLYSNNYIDLTTKASALSNSQLFLLNQNIIICTISWIPMI